MNINYNNTICEVVSKYVERMLSYLPAYDEQERKIVVDDHIVEVDDTIDLYSYIRNEVTCEFTIHFTYSVLDKDGNKIDTDSFVITVPRLINNLFVIDGKLRIPTTVLGSDSSCRVYHNGDEININFDYQRSVSRVGTMLPKITIQEEWGEEPIVVDATAENYNKFREMLKLSNEQRLKLQVKLNTPSVGEYITEDLCNQLFNLTEDKYQDSIVDKVFINSQNSLMRFITTNRSRRDMMRSLRKKFYRYGKVFPTDFQNLINKYFKNASEATIEIPQNVNPLVYNSLSSKLIMPQYVAYNKSFADLIDPVNTPENGNVGRINEFNVCAEVVDGKPYIWCYTYPEFKKVRLLYLEYLNKKVINSNCVNYKAKKIDPTKPGAKYKLREHEYPLTAMPEGDDWLVEPKPDERLSLTTRRIPMVNMSDTVRVAMGAGMSKQAVELENSEPCLVSSGNEDEDEHQDTTRQHWMSEETGRVVAISQYNIMVKLDSGPTVNFDIPETTVGLNNTLISYVVKVKVGDVVKPGTLMVSSFMTRNKQYQLGLNAHVAYAFYKGYNHEDAIIISESFAKRCAAYQIVDVVVPISCFDVVSSIIPLYTRVKSTDKLIDKQTRFRPKGATEALLNTQAFEFIKEALSYYSSDILTPNNIEEGYVTDVALNISPDWAMIAHNNGADPQKLKQSLDYLTEYESKKDEKRSLTIIEHLPQRYLDMRVREADIDPRDGMEVAALTLRIVRYSPAHHGTKFCNRWGSKGEVSLVLPDDQMLHDENGRPFDMILNPPSIVKRKNPSQLMEVLLSKVIETVYEKALPLAKDNKVKELRELLTEFYGDQYDDCDDVELVEGVKRSKFFLAYKVGSMSTYGRDKVLALAKKAGVSDKEYVIDPDPEIGELENPVITGDTYYMRLFHSADYTAKVTSSLEEGGTPLLGHGEYREGGQKFGEMENWGLMSYGVQKYFNPDSLLKEGTFLNEMLLAGYTIEVNGKPALLTENHELEK